MEHNPCCTILPWTSGDWLGKGLFCLINFVVMLPCEESTYMIHLADQAQNLPLPNIKNDLSLLVGGLIDRFSLPNNQNGWFVDECFS